MLKKPVFFRWFCIIALLTLSLNAALPVSPTQAYQIDPTGPYRAASPALKPLTGDSSLAQPSINAKPVLERANQMGDGLEQRIQRERTPAVNKLGKQQVVSSTPDKKQTAQTQSRPVDKRVPAALLSQAKPPATMNAGKTNLPAFNALTSLQSPITDGCYNWLYNSDFETNSAEGWLVYRSNVYFDTNAYASPTTSLLMQESESGDSDVNSSGDVDAFGQVFYFPDWYEGIDINSLDIWFQTADFSSAGDSLSVLFYDLDANGNLNNYLGGKAVPLDGSGAWTSHYFPVNYNDLDVSIPNMKGKNVAIVLAAFGDNDLTAPYDISVDDVYMSLCTSPTVPTGMIFGRVTQSTGVAGEYDLGDAPILLTYADATTDGPQVIDFAVPDAEGYYAFYSLFPLPDDGSGTYQIWYMNENGDDSRVMLWQGPSYQYFADGDWITAEPFDISNVDLLDPPNEEVVTLTSGLNFSWSNRGVPDEGYYWCMYDELSQLSYNTVCSGGPIYGTSLNYTADDFSGVPGFLVDGHRYQWYVLPTGTSGLGYSYYMNGITILFEAPPVIIEPPTSGDTPPTGPDAREWLLMIYLAGDNNLGDPALVNGPSSFIKHFETLQEIAPAYTNMHVVTLTDFYDSSGTQICYISVKPAECKQLGELDTADPQTLTNFIDTAIAGFEHNRTALVISDHGHGISGLAVDETTHRVDNATTLDGYMMNPTELRTALANAGLNTTKLNLLYFNTCLMGNLETAYSVKDFANYMVASSNEMWMMDIYTAMLPLINNTTAPGEKDLAINLAKAYGDKISALGYPTSIAAYDLSWAANVWQAVSDLGAKLSTLYDDSSLTELKDAMKVIRIDAQQYDSSGDVRIDQEDAFTDLKHLVTMLSDPNRMENVDVVDRANTVKNLLPSLVIYSKQRSGTTGDGVVLNLGNANGLSVYFPDRNEGTQLTLTNQIDEKLVEYVKGNEWITYTDKFVQYILGNPNTNPGGASTSGPAHISSGVLPPSGALGQEFNLFLPSVRR